ncbi:hypothetical protein [Curtobacterium sp. MCBD17_032]|uniref:hypothetical protein n=1 Tax=Curtobacterium sp. MCBD17_032 TaxID=2175659 RepID=UPI000DA9860F|nr:hypothetical protein [Curtobacterium sp. MCBD17_032]PZE86900.1 hypothetical protein DEI91_00925 [Curtobacterium sp. MCBD17_032]
MDKDTNPDRDAEQRSSLADLDDESIGHVFDQTNGLADGLTGDSDGVAGDDDASDADRGDAQI